MSWDSQNSIGTEQKKYIDISKREKSTHIQRPTYQNDRFFSGDHENHKGLDQCPIGYEKP